MTGGWFIISVLILFGLVGALIRWVASGAGELRVQAAEPPSGSSDEEAPGPILCTSCLEPLPANTHFCPACGHASGLYNNLSPYLYIFSMGECLRAGTHGKVRPSFLTVVGYFFLSLIQYNIFAPIYWYQMMRNWQRQASPEAPAVSSGTAQ